MKKIVLLCLTIVLISYNHSFGFSAGFMGSGAAKNAPAGGLPSPDFEACWGTGGCPSDSGVGATDEQCTAAPCPGTFSSVDVGTMSVSSGTLVHDMSSDTSNHVRYNPSAITEFTAQFDITFSVNTGWDSGSTTYHEAISHAGGDWRWATNSSGAFIKLRAGLGTDYTVTISGATTYTVTIYFKTGSGSGIAESWFDGVYHSHSQTHSEAAALSFIRFFGYYSTVATQSETITYDNLKVWYSDQITNLGLSR